MAKNMEELLKKCSQKLATLDVDQYEIYYDHRSHTSIDSKDLKTEAVSRAEDLGISIRILKDKKMGFSYTTSLEWPLIETAMNKAIEISQLIPEDPHIQFPNHSQYIYSETEMIDEKGLKTPFSEKVEIAKKLEDECKKADKRIAGVRAAQFSETLIQRALVGNSGEIISQKKSLFSVSITCKAEGNGDSQMGSDFGFSHELSGLDLTSVARSAAEYATEILDAKPGPTLKCPAIFRNTAVSDLLSFLASSFSAESIDKGRSLLAGKKGERLFSESITLVDDSTLQQGYASRAFDAEGIPSQKTVLVDGGFLTQYLYDSYYAKKQNTTSTSNAVRGIKSPPSIGVSNFLMQPGKKSFQKLVSQISKGVIITDLMGMHTANSVTGDFSLGASGLMIENGKITHALRGFAVAGNVLELFRKVTDTGSDLKLFGNICTPSICIEELSVSGA